MRPTAPTHTNFIPKLIIALGGALASTASAGLIVAPPDQVLDGRYLTVLMLLGLSAYLLAALAQASVMAALRWIFQRHSGDYGR